MILLRILGAVVAVIFAAGAVLGVLVGVGVCRMAWLRERAGAVRGSGPSVTPDCRGAEGDSGVGLHRAASASVLGAPSSRPGPYVSLAGIAPDLTENLATEEWLRKRWSH
jgi:hypothetical protein